MQLRTCGQSRRLSSSSFSSSPFLMTSPLLCNVLGKSSNLAEVLWNFSRRKDEKRLTLRENPHFYKGLPASPEAYGDGFRLDPIDDFLDPPRVYVLIDRPGRLYLESDGSCWAFGNVWVPNKSIIFKNVCGKLEGEGIVGASIQDKPNLRYHLEDTSSTNSVGWKSIQDWRDPIRRMLKSQDISIRIGAEQYKTPQTNPLLRSNPRHRPSGSSNPAKPTHSGDAPPSSVLTLPPPTLQTGIPSKDGAAPSASLSRESPTSSLTDQATRAPASSIALTSRNISQPSESQAGAITKDTPSISRKLIVEGHTSTLSVAVTSLPGVTSPLVVTPRGGRLKVAEMHPTKLTSQAINWKEPPAWLPNQMPPLHHHTSRAHHLLSAKYGRSGSKNTFGRDSAASSTCCAYAAVFNSVHALLWFVRGYEKYVLGP
ncbi:hypothetical protein BJV74DRAFT_284172 [Russula compacta]|nr:hypothetical protein BJV74DRAFT_284172 [Russula compacta]